MPKVVVYYRSQRTRNLVQGTTVTLLQKKTVEEWARASEYGPDSGVWEIIGEYHDNYKGRDNVTKSDLPGLDKAIEHCERDAATLVFVNIKMWRPNPFIDDKIAQFVRRHGANRKFVIPTRYGDGAHEIIEFFYKQKEARDLAKKRAKRSEATKRGIRNAKEETGVVRDADELKKAQKRGGQMRRLKSLKILLIASSYIADCDRQGFTNEQIAQYINKNGLKTVCGRSWTADGIRKAKKSVYSPDLPYKYIAAMTVLSPSYSPPDHILRFSEILRERRHGACQPIFSRPTGKDR